MYAGGEVDQRHLRYKIGCESDAMFMAKRLRYERRGTPTECLRKGYGFGETHRPWQEEDDDEVQTLEDDLQHVLSLELVFSYPPPRGPIQVRRLPSEQQTLNSVVAGFTIFDDEGRYHEQTLLAIERLQPSFSTPLPNNAVAHFFGLEEPGNPFHRVREYRFLEHTFDIHRVKSVFSEQDLQYMFHAQLLHRSLLFAMPIIGEHLDKNVSAFHEQNTLLCEVDFANSKIVFYAPPHARLEWYANIMVQQFVMPRAERIWRIRKMEIAGTIPLLFVITQRLQNLTVTQDEIQELSLEQQSRIVYAYIQHIERQTHEVAQQQQSVRAQQQQQSVGAQQQQPVGAQQPQPVSAQQQPQPVGAQQQQPQPVGGPLDIDALSAAWRSMSQTQQDAVSSALRAAMAATTAIPQQRSSIPSSSTISSQQQTFITPSSSGTTPSFPTQISPTVASQQGTPISGLFADLQPAQAPVVFSPAQQQAAAAVHAARNISGSL